MTHPWILLEHDLVHDLLKDLVDREAHLSGQVEEGDIFLQKPRPIGSEEHQGLAVLVPLQCLLNRRDELLVLRVVEQHVREDEQIEPGRVVTEVRAYLLPVRAPEVALRYLVRLDW